MRQIFPLLLLIMLFAACQPKESQPRGEPLLREITSQEIRQARLAASARASKYQAELALAPVYRSATRNMLIANPFRFRSSGRSGFEEFYYTPSLPNDFRCIHPVSVIAQASKDRWDLVRCDQSTAYFLRSGNKQLAERHTKKRIAPLIEERFQILRITFAEAALAEVNDRAAVQKRYLYSAMPTATRPTVDKDFTQLGIPHDNSLVVRVTDLERYIAASILDLPNKMLVSVSQLEDANGCERRSTAFKIIGQVIVSVSDPCKSYSEMIDLLSIVSAYSGGK